MNELHIGSTKTDPELGKLVLRRHRFGESQSFAESTYYWQAADGTRVDPTSEEWDLLVRDSD